MNSSNQQQILFININTALQENRPVTILTNTIIILIVRRFIAFYKLNGKWKLSKFQSTHNNHTTTEVIYRFNNAVLDNEDRDLVLSLNEANAKPSQIKCVLLNRTEHRMPTQKIKNVISKRPAKYR